MFKAVLVIFVLGIGKGGGEKGGNVSVVPFQSMDQCKEAIVHAEDVINDWHYGDNKDDVVPVRKTMKCFPITPVALPGGDTPSHIPPAAVDCPTIVIPDEPPPKFRQHKRWDR